MVGGLKEIQTIKKQILGENRSFLLVSLRQMIKLICEK
jgi:hypothetical protein